MMHAHAQSPLTNNLGDVHCMQNVLTNTEMTGSPNDAQASVQFDHLLKNIHSSVHYTSISRLKALSYLPIVHNYMGNSPQGMHKQWSGLLEWWNSGIVNM